VSSYQLALFPPGGVLLQGGGLAERKRCRDPADVEAGLEACSSEVSVSSGATHGYGHGANAPAKDLPLPPFRALAALRALERMPRSVQSAAARMDALALGGWFGWRGLPWHWCWSTCLHHIITYCLASFAP
jgi:hypothetical protein